MKIYTILTIVLVCLICFIDYLLGAKADTFNAWSIVALSFNWLSSLLKYPTELAVPTMNYLPFGLVGSFGKYALIGGWFILITGSLLVSIVLTDLVKFLRKL